MLNLPPDSSKIPDKYRDQMATRTVLRTWQANRAALSAAKGVGGINIADLFSPVLPYVAEVHCKPHDAVHMYGCWKADMMRLQLLACMCTGEPWRIHFSRSLSGLRRNFLLDK